MPSHSARKNSGRAEDKRYGHKRARQATRQVLDGGHHPGVVHGVSWSNSLEQPPINDDIPIRPHAKRKGCKRNKGGAHTPVQGVKRVYGFNYSVYFCSNCNKILWRYRPAPSKYDDDHWTTAMILLRLAEGQDACTCSSCKDKYVTNETKEST